MTRQSVSSTTDRNGRRAPPRHGLETGRPPDIPAVNNVAGMEVRLAKYLHWHTFLGYFMEIKDGVFSAVLRLRQKKSKNQTLDKEESEFWQNNKKICVLETRLTAEEQAAYDRFDALFS